MDLQTLEQRNVPTLRITEPKREGREHMRSRKLINPKDPDFAISFKDSKTIEIPVLKMNDHLLVGTFIHGAKKFTPYMPMVYNEVVFKKAYLMKIERRFGVYILNPNEEKHLKEEVLYSEPIYLRYSFSKRKWVIINDGAKDEKGKIEQWEKAQEELNELQASDEVDAAAELFENIRTYSLDVPENEKTYAAWLEELKKPIEAINRYFKYQYIFSEISEAHYEKIYNRLKKLYEVFHQVKKFLKANPQYTTTPRNAEEEKTDLPCINQFDVLKKYIRFNVNAPGYWVDDVKGIIYENPAEHFNLKQQADDNRTRETKRILKEALFAHIKKLKAANPNGNVNQYVQLTDPLFVETLNDVKQKKTGQN